MTRSLNYSKPYRNRSEDYLTERELEVAKLILSGKYAVRDIAFELGIKLNTAKQHKHTTLRKLQVTSAAELVAYAFRNPNVMEMILR